MSDGGYVVTFTDVTQQRMASADLDEAKRTAELAQTEAMQTLENEKARQRDASMLAELGDWLQTCKSLNELYIVLKECMRQMLPSSRGELCFGGFWWTLRGGVPGSGWFISQQVVVPAVHTAMGRW